MSESQLPVQKQPCEWYIRAELGQYCDTSPEVGCDQCSPHGHCFSCVGTRCVNCDPHGVCDSCDTIEGRYMSEVNNYASTCDYCSDLSMHESMIMHPETHLGLCDRCQDKGISIDVLGP